jgi:hypothetical protein
MQLIPLNLSMQIPKLTSRWNIFRSSRMLKFGNHAHIMGHAHLTTLLQH